MRISLGVAVLLLAGLAVTPALFGYAFLARAAICGVAFAAALQAGRADRNLWLLGLVAIAAVFNPVTPVEAPGAFALVLIAAAIATLIGWGLMLDRIVTPQTVAEVMHPTGLPK